MDYTNPHSCPHCEGILLSRPEDHPDLHEGSEPRQSLLLLKVLRSLRDKDPVLKTLEGAFFLEVDLEQLSQFVSDGCLFYKFISTGLDDVDKYQEYDRRRRNRPSPQYQVHDEGVREPNTRLVIIELKDNAVEISTTYRTQNGGHYLQTKPRLLNHCVFGVFPEEG
jgi:hypothetical protein